MPGYSKHINVSKDDLDDLDHVNNVRYVQWIQDISKEHWQKTAPLQMQEEVIWVVMSHYIEYKSAALLNDKIEITTYIEKSGGAKCTRIVEMINEATQTLLLKSSTEWCLLKRENYRPTRITEEIKEIFL